MQPIKTWTPCNNTRKLEKHVAENEPRATQNTTQLTSTEKCTTGVNSRQHTHTTRQNMEHKCPYPDTEPKLSAVQDMSAGIRTQCSNMKQGNRAHRWEYTRSCMLTRKQRMRKEKKERKKKERKERKKERKKEREKERKKRKKEKKERKRERKKERKKREKKKKERKKRKKKKKRRKKERERKKRKERKERKKRKKEREERRKKERNVKWYLKKTVKYSLWLWLVVWGFSCCFIFYFDSFCVYFENLYFELVCHGV